ncbi:PAS domain S-box protein [Azospirillum brasilense]|uniref:PAS domain S-box protein n=1 Tax=Azospirillum brasilense TaxID=192 RepID=UPI003CE48317
MPTTSAFLASLAESLMHQASFALVYADAGRRCLFANPAFAAVLRTSPEDLAGRCLAEFDHPLARSIVQALDRSGQTGEAAPVDCEVERADGGRGVLTGCVLPHRTGDGGKGFLGLFQDVTDPARVADFVLRRDPFVTTLLDAAVDGVVVADRNGIIRTVNRSCRDLFGYDEEELIGRNVSVLMPPPFSRDHDKYIGSYLETDRAKIIGIGRDALGRRKDGAVFPIHLSVGQARLARDVVFVGIIRDISERLAAEQKATYLARHDPLTGVLTRTAFLEECEAVLAAPFPGQEGGLFALYALDVDQFSDINEAFGFHVGDAALKAMVSRVTEVLPQQTYVCRIAADEFAALSRVESAEQAETLADLLHDRLTASIYADRHWVRLRLSIGAAVQDADIRTLEELNAKAKLALQAAQHNGGNAVCFYTPEMAAAATRRMFLTMHLAHAIERNELHMAYQPIVEARSGRIVGAEALLRWNQHTLGAVSPGEFIPGCRGKRPDRSHHRLGAERRRRADGGVGAGGYPAQSDIHQHFGSAVPARQPQRPP